MQTCVVGCKLPHGLVVTLMVGAAEQEVTLAGANTSRIVGGYGLTKGVPKEPFEKWLRDHAAMPFVRAGHVFMEINAKRAESHAREFRGLKTRMEPLDPTKVKGLVHDKESNKDYNAAKANNPDRNRQIVE